MYFPMFRIDEHIPNTNDKYRIALKQIAGVPLFWHYILWYVKIYNIRYQMLSIF